MQEPSRNGLINRHYPVVGCTGATTLRYIALMSTCAAAAHGAVIKGHLREWPAAGVFFIVVTLLQAFVGLRFAKVAQTPYPSVRPRLIISALTINVGIVLVYVVSRTIPIPFAPKVGAHGSASVPGVPIIPSRVESIGPLDAVTFLIELVTIGLLVSIARGSTRRTFGNVLLACGGGLVVAAVTGTL